MLEQRDSKGDAAREGAMSRRSLLAAGFAVGGATMLVADVVRAEGEHAGHRHGDAQHQALIDAALACINRGEVCVAHCHAELGRGDTMLKDCLRTVSAMLPMCSALVRLAALDASRLKEFAKVCIDVCADCEAECKKHAEHHAVCKACMESCTACIKECKTLA